MDPIKLFISIEYLGGHPSYMKKDKGQIRVSENDISFWSGTFKKQQKFSIPLQDLIRVELQEKDKITLTRALLLGPFSLIFKKNKRYLVMYFSTAGMESGAIFDFPSDIGDSNKKSLMEVILNAKKQFTTPPPPSDMIVNCPTCGTQARLISQYNRYYCDKCKEYLPI